MIKKAIVWTLLVTLSAGGCAWQRGRADKKTVRRMVFDFMSEKPAWTTYHTFHHYVAQNKQYLSLDGFRICYVQKGQGQTVILVHGLFGSKNVWRGNFLPLAEHFRVVMVDMPGSGDSDNPHHTKYPYTPENMADTLLSVMDKLEIERAHIVGNSLGGLMALLLARNHPERVQSLVLISPAVWDYSGKLQKAVGLFFGVGPALSAARPTQELANSLLDSTVCNPHALTPADRYEASKSLLQEGARDALIEKARHLFRDDYLRQVSTYFRGLRTRTLIIWGEEDAVIPSYVAYMLYEELPNSTILWLPQCGHHPQEEAPKFLNREVPDFLRGQGSYRTSGVGRSGNSTSLP